jgi:glycosyltransferase involved in cell wall biosynthesis
LPEVEAPATLSVALITFNEEQNLLRTLASVSWADQIVVVDSGSTDRTVKLARAAGAHVLIQPWLGFAAQKNFAIEHCRGDWILSLDADEGVSDELAREIRELLRSHPEDDGFLIPRRNFFLGRAMLHGGFYPDPKLRLFRRTRAAFAPRSVHETMRLDGVAGSLKGELLHFAYPTLAGYIEHMNRYSTLAAEELPRPSFLLHVLVNPIATFLYNYILRLGFLDGREGLLLHIYHSCYVSWKYAKAWERSRPVKTNTL